VPVTPEERAERVRLFKEGRFSEVNQRIRDGLIRALRSGEIVSVRELKDSRNGGVGSALAKIIERDTGVGMSGSAFQNGIGKLNMMLVDEINQNIEELSETLAPEVSRGESMKIRIREAIETAGS
jgi:hypothetical protein